MTALSPPAQAPDHTARHLHQLERAAAVGMRLLDILERHAEALPVPASPDAAASLGLAYHRITRALRQTIALEKHIREPAPLHDSRGQEREARRHTAEKARQKRQKSHVRDLVAHSIGTDEKIRDRESRLLELDERLDDEDMQQILLTRPIAEIVSTLCDELGVSLDCSHWEDPLLGDLMTYEKEYNAALDEAEAAETQPKPEPHPPPSG